MKRVTLTAFMVCAAWLSFGQTARFGDLNRNSVVVTSAPPQSVVSVNGQTGAVEITAAQIGALTNETDEAALAALAAYAAYWPPNATASSWFTFTTNANEITITDYNIEGGTDVVIPDYINGWPVTGIGASAFTGSGVTSIGGAGNVVTVGDSAFEGCTSLASVSLPQAQTVGDYAFDFCTSLTSVPLPQVQTVGYSAFIGCNSLASVLLPQVQTVENFAFGGCTSLTSVYFDNDAPTIEPDIFANIPLNQVTNYVTNPQATGWGATLGGIPGMPVVRLPLYADAIYQAGELVATTGHVAQAIASQLPGIVYSNSVSALTIYTNASGAATSWWQVASGVTNSGSFASGTPGAITNGAEHVEFGASSPFSGYPNFNPPDSALSIFAPAKFIYVDSNVGGFWGIKFRGTGGGGFTDIFGFTANGNTGEIQLGSLWPTYYMSLMSGGETRVTLKKDGKVGIGTTEPSENFEVVGSCKSSGTNTAAVVRSQSFYLLPHLGTNTTIQLIFTNGTLQAWEVAQ